jgi:hypothetical protein
MDIQDARRVFKAILEAIAVVVVVGMCWRRRSRPEPLSDKFPRITSLSSQILHTCT